jgi:hypothetical protein
MELAFFQAAACSSRGCDPTGNGGTIPGFADLREIELLVEGGFTPVAGHPRGHPERRHLSRPREDHRLVEPGKNADLSWSAAIPARPSPTSRTSSWSSRDGIGFDPVKLLESVKGRYGQY